MTQTLSLFDKTLEARFMEFHGRNPKIYNTLVSLAREAKNAGKTRIGIKSLWETMRWHLWVATDHAVDEPKLNNNYTAYYARLIAAQEHDLRDIFEIRRLRAAA